MKLADMRIGQVVMVMRPGAGLFPRGDWLAQIGIVTIVAEPDVTTPVRVLADLRDLITPGYCPVNWFDPRDLDLLAEGP